MKKVLPYVLSGLLAVSTVAFATTDVYAAGHGHQMQGMAQDEKPMMGQMNPTTMQEMMKSPDFMPKMMEMMQKPEMQSMMKEMMQKPEMQATMKQMMLQDGKFHQMMIDLVNSVEAPENHEHTASKSSISQSSGHSEHH